MACTVTNNNRVFVICFYNNKYNDTGRVWEDGLVPGELLSDLHTAYGGGIRAGMGENFVAALDIGHSAESTASIYINVGYLF